MTPHISGWVATVKLTQPSLQDNTSDADRLAGALRKALSTDVVRIDFEILKNYRICSDNGIIRCAVWFSRSMGIGC